MKMMGSLFACHGIPAVIIEAGANAFLNGFNNFLILQFNGIQAGTCSFVVFIRIDDIGKEGDFCLMEAKGLDDVYGKTPGIEVEHGIGENEKIIGGHLFSEIG
jgi:hypothetical protein